MLARADRSEPPFQRFRPLGTSLMTGGPAPLLAASDLARAAEQMRAAGMAAQVFPDLIELSRTAPANLVIW